MNQARQAPSLQALLTVRRNRSKAYLANAGIAKVARIRILSLVRRRKGPRSDRAYLGLSS